MADRKYLIGFGERLVQNIDIPTGGAKTHPYTYEIAKQRLQPKLRSSVDVVSSLRDVACPNDESVISISLHPSYLAKSYFPGPLFRELGLRSVGSRARKIRPEILTDKRLPPDAMLTSPELFIAGQRAAFDRFLDFLSSDQLSEQSKDCVRRIEDIQPLDGSRLHSLKSESENVALEVVLHDDATDENYIVSGFGEFLEEFNLTSSLQRRIHSKGLCFLPVITPKDVAQKLTEFSFVRVVREMPRLRISEPVFRRTYMPGGFQVNLPDEEALDPNIKVAVFDGGLSESSPLTRWATPRSGSDTGQPSDDGLKHGNDVTSALLFGPLNALEPPQRPYANVDHWCVVDNAIEEADAYQLYDTLSRITSVLQQNEYDFINLSLGPDLPMEDAEPHAWTATLDEYLASGRSLMTVAAGNTGEDDWESGNARIQPPSDAVNVLSIGAADSQNADWRRAPYSSIGPGRSPGFVKPDIVAFGGSGDYPFHVLDADDPSRSVGTQGTSFASPFALRSGIGIKAHFGAKLGLCAIKALMVHRADSRPDKKIEVGHGRLPSELDDIVICSDSEAHIVFQGMLPPRQYMRFPIPIPSETISGMVEIKATFTFMADVDPQDALNYTRSGLEVRMRPDTKHELTDGSSTHDSKTWFQAKDYYQSEAGQRSDAHKWETTVTKSSRFRGSSLRDPVFDVKYHGREQGRDTSNMRPIPYALIITVSAKKAPTLYNDILTRYRTQLEMVRPQIDVPIRVRR